MVEINSNASGLRSQLQAQLQSDTARRTGRVGDDQAQRPQDIVTRRVDERIGERSEANRQAPTQRSSRSNDLSSSGELVAAEERVNQLNANNREAPIGRTSQQASSGRNIPLGQIVDIRV